MVNDFLIETLADYENIYTKLEEMGAPKEGLEIIKKSIDANVSIKKSLTITYVNFNHCWSYSLQH